MTSNGVGVSRPRVTDVDRLEQDIARGTRNTVLMARYGLTYEGLKGFIDGMSTGQLSNELGSNGQRLLPCGTTAAYRRHRAAGEVPDSDCVRAMRRYNKHRSIRRRAA